MTEESSYYHTLIAFNDLLRKNIKGVLDDLKQLDLTTYEELVKTVEKEQGTEKKVAALLKACM